MENSTPTQPKKFPWLLVIIVIIVILALLQWWQTSPDAEPITSEPYSTSTPITTVPTTPATSETLPVATSTPVRTTNTIKNLMHTITLETSKGTIVFETYDADAPKTVENFITLAKKGYYTNVIFHRVIEGFMIQGGDPTGTGMGGASAWGGKFADELNPATESYKRGYVRGTVAMANAGPNTNGSQFFIMHKDYPLPNNYTIFGRVVSGLEVVDAIATTPRNGSDKPLTDVTIKKATVAEKK